MSETIQINLPSPIKLNKAMFQKMLFLTNAIEKGWTVKKSNDSFIFTKKHENKREVFQEDYLETFVSSNFTTDFVTSSGN
jgi:hypothetical protein|tara:strand:- start:1575 stop:1814 length:240 start_codon:yes stop_codon:yes gene_type:complete